MLGVSELKSPQIAFMPADLPGFVSISDISVVEGDSGSTLATMTITRSGGTSAFELQYSTSDGTAVNGDYRALENGFFFAEGEMEKTFQVTIFGDIFAEFNETFFVDIADVNNSGAVFVHSHGQVTIIDNDIEPSLDLPYWNLADQDFSQNWNNLNQINFDNIYPPDASIVGFRGNGLLPTSGSDVQTILESGSQTPIVVTANQVDPVTTDTSEGIAEFSGPFSPMIGLRPSYANSPHLLILLDTTDRTNVVVSFDAIDIDDGARDALTSVVVQYRVGDTGTFINLPDGYIADATDGPDVSGRTTHISVTLPVETENQGKVQVRILAATVGFHANEWVGIDDISVTSQASPNVVAGSVIVSDVTIVEGDSGTSLATFTVTRSGGLAAFDLDYSTADGTALSVSDYVAKSGTVSFAQGQLTAFVTVAINGDTTAESDENFFLNLLNPTNGAIISDGQGQGTITNDDVSGSVSISDVTISEGDFGTKIATFTVTRDGGTAPFDVTYATADGTATAGSDYTVLASTVLSFGAGETSKTISVTINGDTTAETDETFFVNLSNATNGAVLLDAGAHGTPGQGQGTITNDDVSGSVSISDVIISEGDTGTKVATFTVTRSGGTAPFDVTYETTNGTATAGSDYTALASTVLHFGVNENIKTISVTINGDTTAETDETFFVNLTNATNGAVLLDAGGHGVLGQGQGTITNDDVSGVVSISDVIISEGDAGTKVATFTVTRDGGTAPFDVTYATANGTATAGSDYTALASTVLHFGVNDLSKTISVTINGDTTFEPNETFFVNLSNATNGAGLIDISGRGIPGQGLGTITNDDPAAVLSIAATDANKAEGAPGGTFAFTPFTFTVTRTGDLSAASSASYTVTDSGTNPTNDADFNFFSAFERGGTVDFAAGESAKTITVAVKGDLAVEQNETFTVTLTGASGAALGTSTAIGTIVNDDITLTLAPNVLSQAEGSGGGTTPFDFTVTRAGDLSVETTFTYGVGRGPLAVDTLLTSTDFTGATPGSFPSGSVTFLVNETTKIISIGVAADSAVESNEQFVLGIGNATGGAVILNSSAIATIVNDDVTPVPDLSIATATASQLEGNSGTSPYTFTVTRSGDLSGASSVDYSVTGGVNAADFGGVLPSGSVSFAATEATKIITLNVSGDTIFEANESFTVSLSNAVGAGIAVSSATGTIVNDDTPAILSIARLDASKAEGSGGGFTPFTFTVSRTGDVSTAVLADYTVRGINTGIGPSAADVTDFGGTFPTGTVSFLAGETQQTLVINVAADNVYEANNFNEFGEGFIVTLQNPTGGASIASGSGSAEGAIFDDDPVPPTPPILGTSGADNIRGTGGNDIIIPGSGNDTVHAANGNDVIKASIRDGNDFYDGGAGNDTIDYSALTVGVNVNLASGFATGQQSGTDILVRIENVIGSSGADTITGNNASNQLDGGAGADRISGGGGADIITGGAGNDFLNAGGGNDTFVFAADFGADRIQGFDANPNNGQDHLDISAFGFTAASFAAHVLITDVGADTLVTIGLDTIRLLGVGNANSITQQDFIL